MLRSVSELLSGLKRRPGLSRAVARVRPMVEIALAALLHEFPPLAAELAIEELIVAEGWEHPAQALEAPYPPFGELLISCEARLKRARGEERAHLLEVRRKIARAERFVEEAKEERARRP